MLANDIRRVPRQTAVTRGTNNRQCHCLREQGSLFTFRYCTPPSVVDNSRPLRRQTAAMSGAGDGRYALSLPRPASRSSFSLSSCTLRVTDVTQAGGDQGTNSRTKVKPRRNRKPSHSHSRHRVNGRTGSQSAATLGHRKTTRRSLLRPVHSPNPLSRRLQVARRSQRR